MSIYALKNNIKPLKTINKIKNDTKNINGGLEMLTILLTAFLSFSSVSSTMNAKSHELNFVTKDDSISGDTYQPKADISYGEYDVGTTYNGIIARHQMISIDSSEYLGPIVVDKLTSTYNAAALENFHFNERISTVEDSTVSTSIELSSEITSGLGVKMNMDDVVIFGNYAIKDIYKIENTVTYSYSEEITKDVSYDVKKN